MARKSFGTNKTTFSGPDFMQSTIYNANTLTKLQITQAFQQQQQPLYA